MKVTRRRRARALIATILCMVLLAWACGSGVRVAWAGEECQWAWMKGANTANQPGICGTLGTPASANTPGARGGAVSWTDPSGALWLFGGLNYYGTGFMEYFNDLWKYDRTTGNWAWMKGSSTFNQSGVYGTLGTPDPANTPGARNGAVSWTDSSGALWLFGGVLSGSGLSVDYINDLWKYDRATGNWTWMKGSSTRLQFGTYGTIGAPSPENTPGARGSAVSWRDASNALWLFGGLGCDSNGGAGFLNDLWKYDPETGNWTWMKGASKANRPGVYGTLGTPDAANTPGGRAAAVSWTDAAGALWLFGGAGYDGAGNMGLFNDLWKYTPATDNWTWMKGSSTAGQKGAYGTLGIPAAANTPGARLAAAAWTDRSGSLWLFGGYSNNGWEMEGVGNDLWKYELATGNWTWMKGSSTINQSGTYGTMGTPAADNTPGARYGGATAWTDPAGAFWLFGGEQWKQPSSDRLFCNDLWCWREVVPPTGSIFINNNRSVTNNPNVTLSLTWSDGAGSGVTRMKFSNDGATWTAWEPLAATKAWTLLAGDGYKTVRVMYRDKAGNNSTVYKDYIRVDTSPPTGSILINGGASTTSSRTVSLGLTWDDDTGAGVTRMRFSIDGSHWSAWEPPVTPKSHTLPATPQYYTVRVQYLDGGNNYSAVYSDYIKLVVP